MAIDSCTVTTANDSVNQDAILFFHSLGKAGIHIFSKIRRATIPTVLRAERSGVQVPVGAKDFSVLQQQRDQYLGLPCLLFVGYRRFFPLCAFVAWVGKNFLTFLIRNRSNHLFICVHSTRSHGIPLVFKDTYFSLCVGTDTSVNLFCILCCIHPLHFTCLKMVT